MRSARNARIKARRGERTKVILRMLCLVLLSLAVLVFILPKAGSFIGEQTARFGERSGWADKMDKDTASADDANGSARILYTERYRQFSNGDYMRRGKNTAKSLMINGAELYMARRKLESQAEFVEKEYRPKQTPPNYKPYHDFYPEMYVKAPNQWNIREKTVYLTFDDGPTVHTEKVLDTLRQKGVKATFFVVGASIMKQGESGTRLLNRMADEGHTIAIHCNVHDYAIVYASVEAFLADFNDIYTKIFEVAGVRANIYRFPGGSVSRFNKSVRDELFAEMERRGFIYYDWNASSGDSSAKVTAEAAYANATSSAGRASRVILLMHDTKKASVDALADIIDKYAEMGYSFRALSNEDKPIKL